jgi:tetratricopeptide (TPR) repeat protein
MNQYVYDNAAIFTGRAKLEPFGFSKRIMLANMALQELKKLSEDSSVSIKICLGEVHLIVGEFASALELFESIKLRVKKEEPRSWVFFQIKISDALIGLGRFEEATALLKSLDYVLRMTVESEKMTDEDQINVIQIFLNSARCHFETGKFEMAVECGEALFSVNRHFEGVYKYSALAHKAMGNLDDAVWTMQMACVYETPWNEANKEEVRALCASLEKERDAKVDVKKRFKKKLA